MTPVSSIIAMEAWPLEKLVIIINCQYNDISRNEKIQFLYCDGKADKAEESLLEMIKHHFHQSSF